MASKARNIADLLNASGKVTADDLDVGQIGGRRNLIINGAMQVAQRGTSWTGVTGNGYYLDRFNQEFGTSGTWTITQSTDAPDGFYNSAKWECTTSATQGVTTFAVVEQRIEKTGLSGLAYGTNEAKDVTLSFWVKGNKTGDYNCNILMKSTTDDRLIVSKYTIGEANTWEYKTITFSGDTVSDIYSTINTGSMQIEWWLGGGSTFKGVSALEAKWQDNNSHCRANETVNLADTVGNYWQITGVQLELGSVATPFEHRSYGEELALCKRYYEVVSYNSTGAYGDIWSKPLNTFTNCWTDVRYTVEKRAIPTFSLVNGATWSTDYSLDPVAQLQNKTSIVFNSGGFYYLTDGSGGNPMAVVDAEL